MLRTILFFSFLISATSFGEKNPFACLGLDAAFDIAPESNEAFAKLAGLDYLGEPATGITRKILKKKAKFYDPKGRLIKDPALLSRLEQLKVPPAWKDVWISPNPKTHIQAFGIDGKGKKQSMYHLKWAEVRKVYKFKKMGIFGTSLGRIRRGVTKFLGEKKGSRELELGVALRLLDKTAIRIGSDAYAEANDTYGISTLLGKHIKIIGSTIKIRFVGKHSKDQLVEVNDKKLAVALGKLVSTPSGKIFKNIEALSVNNYLKSQSAKNISAKDFRTWRALVEAIESLRGLPSKDKKIIDKKITESILTVSKILGNTPAVAKESYIFPGVFPSFRSGELAKLWLKAKGFTISGLKRSEIVALLLLDRTYR